jgi:hypothetical protein
MLLLEMRIGGQRLLQVSELVMSRLTVGPCSYPAATVTVPTMPISR